MYKFREANRAEFTPLGTLMVQVYAALEGFPSEEQQPDYYQKLRDVEVFTSFPKAKVFVAVSEGGAVDGGVVYFGDTAYYGAGGEAVKKQNAAAFRLLAVNPEIRGKGLGKQLIQCCMDQARKEEHTYMIIHSTKTMMTAWKMYERMGFERFEEIDFLQGKLHVYGFRLAL